jgi:hypothetical protein
MPLLEAHHARVASADAVARSATAIIIAAVAVTAIAKLLFWTR